MMHALQHLQPSFQNPKPAHGYKAIFKIIIYPHIYLDIYFKLSCVF